MAQNSMSQEQIQMQQKNSMSQDESKQEPIDDLQDSFDDDNSKQSQSKLPNKDGKNKKRKVGRWYLGETLGKGGYSWVKKGYDRKDGRVVALKFTSKGEKWSDEQQKQVKNEIEALRQVNHKNVLQLLAYNLNGKYPTKDGGVMSVILLVLEYLPGGELFDILYYTNALKEEVARTYFHQLIEAIEACHQAGIIHRDIKPQNLLLDSKFRLKLADFGLAKILENEDDKMSTYFVGTRGYQAPEMLLKQKYNHACDIFSCGVVLFIILSGYPPFENASPKCRWYQPLTENNARLFWKQHRGCGIPSAAKDLITRMLWHDPEHRIGISDIKKHPWYQSVILSDKELIKELKVLHRLMESKRKDDASKQSQLQNSLNKPIGSFMCAIIRPGTRQARSDSDEDNEDNNDDNNNNNNNDNNNNNNKGDNNNDDNNNDNNDKENNNFDIYNQITKEQDKNKKGILKTYYYYENEVAKDIADVVVAQLYSKTLGETLDCTSIVTKSQKIWDHDKQHIIIDNNLFNTLFDSSEFSSNPIAKELRNSNDTQLQVYYSDEFLSCEPPVLPEHMCVTWTDIYTTTLPRLVLSYIQLVILKNSGVANLNIQECSLVCTLATYNIPTPITMCIRIYRTENPKLYLVNFKRIEGDNLHFATILRHLVQQCGYVLTGAASASSNNNNNNNNNSNGNKDNLNNDNDDDDDDDNNNNVGDDIDENDHDYSFRINRHIDSIILNNGDKLLDDNNDNNNNSNNAAFGGNNGNDNDDNDDDDDNNKEEQNKQLKSYFDEQDVFGNGNGGDFSVEESYE